MYIYHFLNQLNHEVTVISPTNWASFLSWMPGADKVIDFERPHLKAKALEAITGADWIFCLDFNTLSRTKSMEQPLVESSAKRILIDHHRQPQTELFAYGESNIEKSSTSEMIYDFITIFQVGIEDCLHIEFEYNKSKLVFHLLFCTFICTLHRLIYSIMVDGHCHYDSFPVTGHPSFCCQCTVPV